MRRNNKALDLLRRCPLIGLNDRQLARLLEWGEGLRPAGSGV